MQDVNPSYQIVHIHDGPGYADIRFSSPVHVLLYSIEGSCKALSTASTFSLNLNTGEYSLSIFPTSKLKITTTSGGNATIAIIMKSEFVQIYLAPFQLDNKEQSALANLNIDIKNSHVLHDIINCGFDGHLRDLYLRAKILELFTLYISQTAKKEKEVLVTLKPEEIEKIAWVKKHIDDHPDVPVTIAQLAKQAGTNEQYLKTHFKMLNDTTVFAYILTKRMEYARNLLVSGNYKISEVAYKSGYKQASHFSSSFKKHFGYLPQKLKSRTV